MGDPPPYHPGLGHNAIHTKDDWERYSLKQTFQSILGCSGIQGNTKSRSLVISFPLLGVEGGVAGGVGCLLFYSYLKCIFFCFSVPPKTSSFLLPFRFKRNRQKKSKSEKQRRG